MTRLLVLLALLWHVIVPGMHARATSDVQSLRAGSRVHVATVAAAVASTTRETTRASQSDDASSALASGPPAVAASPFVVLGIEIAAPCAIPAERAIVRTARGPPPSAA